MGKEVVKINKDIISRAIENILLPLVDFTFMLKELNEIIYEQVRYGQITVIPDGPKPLIFAMSLVALLNEANDVTCLHIMRNETLATSGSSKIPVTARENKIFGFEYVFKGIW